LIDRVQFYVKAGDGGRGSVSFRREKYVPLGGPDGGDGGDGGSVLVEGDGGISTLRRFQFGRKYQAERGVDGKGNNMHGKNGVSLILKVPLGTVVKRSMNDKEELVGDVIEHGQRVVIARGGRGGQGNARFASSTNKAPRFAQSGEKGEEAKITLDLKIIADVGVAGYPNVGKSTLLNRVTEAKSKIADYPFTTLEPVIGIVTVGYRSFILADIPGLIDGAHLGVGLGHDFLRHIERTKVIVLLLDGLSREPATDLKKLQKEMELYRPELLQKVMIVAVNKLDIPEVRERKSEILRELQTEVKSDVFFISAATGEGTEDLIKKALQLLSEEKPSVTTLMQDDEYRVFRPSPVSNRKKYGK